MKLSAACVCLVLFLAVSAVTSRTVTGDEKAKINEGIKAAKDLTTVLQTPKRVSTVLQKVTEFLGPWIDGFDIFMQVLNFFLPEEDALLEEMKKGFMEVNERLDEIKEGLTEVKGSIDWSVVKVNFQGIEQDIRLLDAKLDEVLQAPDSEHGKEEYVRVYESQYNEAGLLLWDSIVNNDQVFYENIITAGMKYTNYHGGKMAKFMYGLIALILKSSNIEVSYENFKEHNRDITVIWQTRINQTIEAVSKADQVLENAWKGLFRGEVDKISKDLHNKQHAYFCNATYTFLTNKYPGRYWWVLSYDEVGGLDNHVLQYYTELGHHRFRHYGRNFVVVCTDPNASFDYEGAQSEIKNITCPLKISTCRGISAKYIVENTPFMGVAKAVIATERYAAIGTDNRTAFGSMKLEQSGWSKRHTMFYFG